MGLGASASGQALGYLFQFERALFWLSDPNIEYVSVETDDDVVANLKDGKSIEVIYEQDKSVLGSSNPFSNSNINLWKTIAIWLEIQKTNPIGKARFVLATNKRVNKNCIMYKLHVANLTSGYKTDSVLLGVFYNDLFDAGAKMKGSSKIIYDYIIISFPKDQITSLLSQIVVSVDRFSDKKDEFKDSIKNNLRIGSNIAFNDIYNKLLGYLVSSAIDMWTMSKDATFYSKKLLNLKDVYIKESLERPFIESAIAFLPILDAEREDSKTKKFIEQLKAISVLEEDYIEAIDDYLLATKQRDKWAENNSVPTIDDLNSLEYELTKAWRRKFSNNIIKKKAAPELTDEDIGNLIYSETIDNKTFFLAGYPITQSYTINGSYHMLSNKCDIGWHPNWEIYFKLDSE